MRGNRCYLPLVVVTFVLAPVAALGEVTLPRPKGFVADHAGIVDDAAERRMAGWLAELQQKTGAFVLVVTVATTDGEDFFGFVQRHFDAWQPGRKGKGDGALIVLAVKEREARIHTGYGLEPIMPDSWCGTVFREAKGRYFKQGNYAAGIELMAVAVANKIAESKNITLSGLPPHRHRSRRAQPRGALCAGGSAPLIVLMVIISSVTRRARYRGRWGGSGLMQGLFLASMFGGLGGGGRRSHWGGGGFGGGFGGGGFGGFGGGMSGGGGGGASW